MASEPSISVIIPAYNAASTLAATLRSVAVQTSPPQEVLVVDDGSTDDTFQIAQNFVCETTEVRVFRRSANSGLPSVGRNLAAAEARGELLAFIDADDYWFPWKLLRQRKAVVENHNVGVFHSLLWDLKGRNFAFGLRNLSHSRRRTCAGGELVFGNRIQLSSALIRAEVFKSLGGFREDRELRAMEDFDLWLRAASTTHVGFQPEVHGVYRIARSSLSQITSKVERHAWYDAHYGTQLIGTAESRFKRLVPKSADTLGGIAESLVLGSARIALGLPPVIVV